MESEPQQISQQRLNEIAQLMHTQAVIAFRLGGAVALCALAEMSLNMLASMKEADGGDLGPDLERIRDAAQAAKRAYEASLKAGIVIAGPGTPVNGKRRR